MNINQLKKICLDFRKGFLERRHSNSMCFVVSTALEGYLGFIGYICHLTKGSIGDYEHYWLTLSTGEIIDATADQFKTPNGQDMPPVYIGKKPEWYKEG